MDIEREREKERDREREIDTTTSWSETNKLSFIEICKWKYKKVSNASSNAFLYAYNSFFNYNLIILKPCQ